MRENGRVFLFAAIVPPQEILDEIWSVAEAASTDVLVEPPPGGRRKTSRRRLLRPKQTSDVDRPGPVLDLARAIDVTLPMAKFGNLALNDANRLAEALTEAATEWSSPRLQLGGCSTLESETDPSIWVDLEGDLDDLLTAIRGVHGVAKGLRFFVDRRVFQPRVRLGGVRPDATEPELEALLARLARFETDAWWQTEFSLLTLVDQGPDLPNYKSFADIPLGPHVVH
jgi:2'-5' RNA ligase